MTFAFTSGDTIATDDLTIALRVTLGSASDSIVLHRWMIEPLADQFAPP